MYLSWSPIQSPKFNLKFFKVEGSYLSDSLNNFRLSSLSRKLFLDISSDKFYKLLGS